jgi:hypothetical protein
MAPAGGGGSNPSVRSSCHDRRLAQDSACSSSVACNIATNKRYRQEELHEIILDFIGGTYCAEYSHCDKTEVNSNQDAICAHHVYMKAEMV